MHSSLRIAWDCGESDAVVDKRQGMERNASMEPFTEVKIEIYIPELLFDLIHGSDTNVRSNGHF